MPNPSSGTFQLSWTGAINYEYTVLTLKDAAQSSSLDAYNLNTLLASGSSLTTSTTTSSGNDLLLDILIGAIDTTHTFGTNQFQTYMGSTADIFGKTSLSYKAAASTPGSESTSRSFSPNDNNDDLALYAFKSVPASASSGTTTNSYTYAGTGYANPHAVTQIANGLSTTSYAYDNNGNATQSGLWTYLHDYLNRITSIGGGNSTSTFGYDTMGARVFQAATTSTTTYASKYFSIASTTLAGASWATTTSYIWLGDTLLGTVDQQFKTGAATGTAKTRYVHPDHLNSTNVVTDENAVLVQTLDYYSFGATRISSATSTNQQRKYIGQFADANSNLSYLNARYYSSDRGQFVSQDPVFWEIAQTLDGKSALLNPQSLNSYAYGNGNPIANKDPNGRYSAYAIALLRAGAIGGLINVDICITTNVLDNLTSGQPSWLSPVQMVGDAGNGVILGMGGELAGALKVAMNPNATRLAKLTTQSIGAGTTQVALDVSQGNVDPERLVSDFMITSLSSYSAGRALGGTRGAEVRSFSSPRLLNGAKANAAASSAVVSQSVQLNLTNSYNALKAAFDTYLASVKSSSSDQIKSSSPPR